MPGERLVDNEVFDNFGTDEPDAELGFGDGIWVDAFTNGTVLRRNFTHGNRMDGIEVTAAGTRLGDNRAEDNDRWGIDAVAGVTDLGGNTATGNGMPAQCRNVLCP